MPVSRHRRARVGGSLAVAVVFGAILAPGVASAANECGFYSTLAAAEGYRVLVSAPGVVLTDAEGGLPAVQATSDSIAGNSAWAGAPYSPQVAGNIPQAGLTGNDVPVFAVAQHPTTPTVDKQTPVSSISASSNDTSADARVVVGGPDSPAGSTLGTTVSGSVACRDDGSLRAVAHSEVTGFTLGPLRIGSVRSEAEAIRGPDGELDLRGSVTLADVTADGVPLSEIDAVPTGDLIRQLDPVRQALEAAGVEIRALEVIENEETGEVTAPGIEIVVTQSVGNLGYGEATVTQRIAGAYARADGNPTPAFSPAPVGQGAQPSEIPGPVTSAVPVVTGPIPLAPSPVTTQAPRELAQGPAPAPIGFARIGGVSIGGVYAAVALGGLLLLLSFGVIDVRSRKVRWR